MRIALFDWNSGGHHELYARRFARALRPEFDVVAAVHDGSAVALEADGVETIALGDPRPKVDPDRPLAEQNRELAERELDLFERVARESGADRLIHLNADPIVRRIVRRPPLPVPTILFFLRARAHFPSAYGSRLSPAERARAVFHDLLVARWRRRPDAYATFALEEEAARRWSRRRGAPAYWIPEPPVAELPAAERPAQRSGIAMYGALAANKGIGLLADALALGHTDVSLTLAGSVDDDYAVALDRATEQMRAAGVRLDLRARWVGETEGLGLLAGARCVALPYPRHYGMSRVLLEAASVGTPVVVHEFGLLGHLVKTHGIGHAVDCTDPRALRAAVLGLAGDPEAPERHAAALARFAERYSPGAFEAAVRAPLQAGAPAVAGVTG